MASTLQSSVASIQINNYVSLAAVTAIGYDYILTFSDEVEYIWNKSWTKVSILFVITRYFGLCTVIMSSLSGSSFIPGPVKVMALAIDEIHGILTTARCKFVFVFSVWTTFIFIGAADLTMLLRVRALYNQSKFIPGALLTLYIIKMILYLAWGVFSNIQSESAAGTAQVLDYSYCVSQTISPVWIEIVDVARMTLGVVMCLLVIIRFIREVLQMYKTTRRFRPNHYMVLLAREGMIYFLVILVLALLSMLDNIGDIPPDGWWTLLGILQLVPPYTLVPRFILSLRALYARDLQGGRGGNTDTAFGFSSRSVHDAAASAIVFADTGQNEGSGQGEEIQMVEMTGGDHGAGSTA